MNFYTYINLNRNELQNAVLQNLGSGTPPANPKLGQIYFDTDNNLIKVCTNPVGPVWEPVGSGTILKASDGTAGAPGFTFTSDLNTGIYREGEDILSIATGGAKRLSISNSTVTSTLPILLPSDPTLALQAATKQYVDAVAQGLDSKLSCRIATVSGVNLPTCTYAGGVLTASANGVLPNIDGVTLVVGDRILVKDFLTTDRTKNGIYTVTSIGAAGAAWSLTRAVDFNTSSEITPGAYTYIEEGTVNGKTGWTLINIGTVTLDTTQLDFTQFSGAGTYVGTTNRITLTGSQIDIASTYIGQNTITTLGTITTGTWNATVIGVGYGGTGLSSYTAGDILYATGAATLAKLAKGTANQLLGMNSGVTAPEYKTLNGTANKITVTHAANSITLNVGSDVALITNVLTLTNATVFTPSGDYHPATKKYVDDAIIAAGGYTDENAQDAVATILLDTDSIDFTYDDVTPNIKADVKVDASTIVIDTTNHYIKTGTNVVITDSVQTLTNKTLTSPKINEAVALTATSTELNILDGATLSTTELNYVKGVTSSIQTQLGGKEPTVSLGTANQIWGMNNAAGAKEWKSFGVIGTSGNAPAWSLATANTITLNIPLASVASVTAGLLSNTDYAKIHSKNTDTTLTGSGINVINTTGAGNIVDFKVSSTVKASVDATGKFTGTIDWANINGEPATYAPSAHTLDSHSNVTTTSNSAGELLSWSGSAWVNKTLDEIGVPSKYTTTIGDAAATEITVTHNLGTQNAVVLIRTTASPYELIQTDVEFTDANNIKIKFGTAPAAGEFTVTIVG